MVVTGWEGPSTMVRNTTYAVLSRNQLCRELRAQWGGGSQKVTNDDEGEGGGVRIPPKNWWRHLWTAPNHMVLSDISAQLWQYNHLARSDISSTRIPAPLCPLCHLPLKGRIHLFCRLLKFWRRHYQVLRRPCARHFTICSTMQMFYQTDSFE